MLTGTFGLYSTKDTDAKIKLDFEDKHGYLPAIIVETPGGKLAGPINAGDEFMPGEHLVTGGTR